MSIDEPLQVYGSGFLPGEPVSLALIIDDIVRWTVGSRTAAQPVANASGAFMVSFDSIIGGGGGERGVIRDRAPGVRTIRAEGEDGSMASAPVMITAAAAPHTSVSTSLSSSAVATLNEAGDAISVDVTVMGAGFMAGEYITVSIIGITPGVDKILAGGSANDSGAFEMTGSLAGAASDDPQMPIAAGVYTLLAIGDSGSEATTPLSVQTPK
jgi:hypothetical protein